MAMWIPRMGMNLTCDEVRVPVKVWEGGAVRVGGTRLTLESVLYAYLDGATPEEILRMFPSTDLGDVYLVIGYYLTRREEADEYLRRCDEEWEQAKAEIDAQPGQKELRDRIRSRAKKPELIE